MKLILPFPPSVNTYWRHPNKGAFAGKSLISAAGRKFQSAACAAIVEQLRRLPKPTSAPASVEIVLFPPDIRLTANQAYHQMAKLGIVEQRERYSRTAINNIKKFWSLTAKGCMFGKNITSPANPRETQPHFFESRFPELLKLLDTVH
ncbi:hypothetical protein [Escherichia coli]|uniref:hypothetical protein n=1 Tax=Escherichia coli TaxID=562 RepID=UPI001117B554|nr:hypothetical protein [Escherichia coli]EFN5043131.1 hypothetical protein [Escherichia coli]EGK2855707.1 hypothetical protein [Escherichia coli]HAH0386890.1 hypothetical protein [Escherichia coli]HAO2052764.1 hypothetical protein [Escherichia coli]HAO2651511.1 hypothetical protein [Escherichia coli]